MAVHGSRGNPVRTPFIRLVAGSALVAGFAIALLTHRASGTERVVNQLLAHRFTAGRLSDQSAWRECPIADSTALVPRMACDPPWAPHWLKIPQADSSSDGDHGRALLELRFGGDVIEKLERALDLLNQAVRSEPRNTVLLNDLAVTYLATAEVDRAHELMHLLNALEMVARAVAADSLQKPALFNRALILQRLYLVASAEAAWTRYLAVETDPRWRGEAEQHLRRVKQWPETTSWDSVLIAPPATMDPAARARIRERVARSLQAAREFGFPLLGAWGAAVIEEDGARARQLLAVAREIGNALDADRSVALAVAAIDSAAGNPRRLRALARGHVLLSEAFRLNAANSYDQLVQQAEAAEGELSIGGSPMARWATFYRASAEVNLRRYDRADSRLRRLAQEAGPQEPALAGKALWALGLSHLRRGIYSVAVKHYREAAPFIAEAREVQNNGSIQMLLTEGLALSGDRLAADSAAYSALHLLSPYRKLAHLGHLLNIVATNVRSSRLSYAAIEIANEAIMVAQAKNDENQLALFFSARARDHEAVGNSSAADADLDAANCWAAIVAPGDGDRVRATVRLAIGQVTRLRDPAAALPILRNAVETYAGSETDLYLPAALHEVALAAIFLGQLDSARGWLAQAMDHVELQRDSFTNFLDQAAFYETVENVFDAAVALEVDARDTMAAFAVMERGRVLIGATPEGESVLPTLRQIGEALPSNTLLVEYALLEDRVVIWTASPREVRQHTVRVTRREVAALAERIQRDTSAAAQDGSGSPTVRLFDLLILPIHPQLTAGTQLIIVPDRELFGVPFAALWDRNGRYLIESRALSTVPSAAFYFEAARRPIRLTDSALIVGNPTLKGARAVDLKPLRWAGREADSVAKEYPGSTVLKGAAARRDSVKKLLVSDRHSIFHFAGHAVLNADQPGQSHLAMASDSSGGSGLMYAWEIGDLRLSNLQVVVLSACSTLGQRATRSGPAAGLAFSFLRAGAPATVSSLWDVDDSAASSLLVEFHRHLAERMPTAEALRQAQMAAIERGISPRAWAAFVYTGP